MKKRQRHQADVRAEALATRDRAYFARLLENVDRWLPVYRVRYPNADRAEIIARLAELVDARRPRAFSGKVRSVVLPDTALQFGFAIPTDLKVLTPFGLTSGVLQASAFKRYDVETKSRSDTQDMHDLSPLGASAFNGSHGANFWLGFTRTDSLAEQIDITSGSPSDRVVHMAVLKIKLPPPIIQVTAVLRASLFVSLPQGVEVINDWGFWDDEDHASFKLDLCGAFLRDSDEFPAPEAFGFTAFKEFKSSSRNAFSTELDMTRTVTLAPGGKPTLFLGIRWTFEAADSRIQTGFAQHVLDARFGFRHPQTGARGLAFSYVPELELAQ
jgi:hypothetical protein